MAVTSLSEVAKVKRGKDSDQCNASAWQANRKWKICKPAESLWANLRLDLYLSYKLDLLAWHNRQRQDQHMTRSSKNGHFVTSCQRHRDGDNVATCYKQVYESTRNWGLNMESSNLEKQLETISTKNYTHKKTCFNRKYRKPQEYNLRSTNRPWHSNTWLLFLQTLSSHFLLLCAHLFCMPAIPELCLVQCLLFTQLNEICLLCWGRFSVLPAEPP